MLTTTHKPTQEGSLSQRILTYLRNHPDYINGGDIEMLAMQAGYKASNASRRLRELCEDELIVREERKGKRTRSVYYKINENKQLSLI